MYNSVMQFFKNKRDKNIKQEYPVTATNGTTWIILVIFAFALVFLSFYFSKTLEKYIIDQKTNIVLDLVANLAKKHLAPLGDTTPLTLKKAGEYQKIFGALEIELSSSLPAISAMKLFSSEGEFLWSSISGDTLGTYYEAKEIKQAIATGSYIGEPEKTEIENDSEKKLRLFARILNEERLPIAVIGVNFSQNDSIFYDQNMGMVFAGITITTIIIIYYFLFFIFRVKDNKLMSQSIELQEIINQSPVGIYTINTDGYIETYNPAMMRISGITDPSETIGKNIFDAVAYKKSGLDKLLRGGLEGTPFETEAEIESSLGGHKRTWRHYYGVPIKNSRRNVMRLLVMVEDITEHKELESRVHEYGETLEKRIQERTALLEEKISELERFERLTIDRELRMVELKQEIEAMRIKLESKNSMS